MNEPTPIGIGSALKSGGLPAVDELFYPGSAAQAARRAAGIDRTTARRDRWPEETIVNRFNRGSAHIGVRWLDDYYFDGIWVGYIKDVSGPSRYSHAYYETQDGERFHHWGGSDGAHGHLKDKFWLYGDPPITFWQSVAKKFSFLRNKANGNNTGHHRASK